VLQELLARKSCLMVVSILLFLCCLTFYDVKALSNIPTYHMLDLIDAKVLDIWTDIESEVYKGLQQHPQ